MRAFIFVCCFVVACGACAVNLHVAPEGDDRAEGSKKHPLRTLNAALERVSANGHRGKTKIVLRDGNYFLPETVQIPATASGVSIEAARHANPRLIGGVQVKAEQLRPVEDGAVLERLTPEARAHVVVADLTALGFKDIPPYPDMAESPPVTPELFLDGERQVVARWPNAGWAEIAEVIESGPAPWRNRVSDKLPSFRYEGDAPTRWRAENGVWLQGYWCFDWHIDTVKLGAIDPAQRAITLATAPAYGVGGGNPAKRRFIALNVLEELDQPGEYCLDFAARRLYYWPPVLLAQQELVLSRLRGPMIAVKDAAHVTLKGLNIEMGQDTGVRVDRGEDVCIEGCTVRNMGLQGIYIDGGQNHRVTECEIFNTGTGGLRMGGGDRKTLTPSGHVAENNYIHHVGRRQRTHADHVDLAGVGVRLAHNLISDGPHQGIVIGGNDHVIEYNEIHHVGMDSDDCGAFYMGRNPSERGTVIRYNYWHDLGSTFAHGSCAIYFDDGAGGQTVYGNVFYRAAGGSFGAIFNHGGHDNLAENNIFIDCKRAIGAAPWNDNGWREWMNGDLWKTRLREEVDITSPVYLQRYPELAGFFDWEGKPRRNHAVRNLFYHCEDSMNGNWDDAGNVSTGDDPGFRDAAAGDFALKRRAAILRELPELKKIPFKKIGMER